MEQQECYVRSQLGFSSFISESLILAQNERW